MLTILKTDAGGTYMLVDNGEILIATGERTGTTYTSSATSLRITGKVRNQGTMRNAFPYSVGKGQRAVLSLDTGEGIVDIPGVILR